MPEARGQRRYCRCAAAWVITASGCVSVASSDHEFGATDGTPAASSSGDAQESSDEVSGSPPAPAGSSTGNDDTDGGIVLDVGVPDTPPADAGCDAVEHAPCDADPGDPFAAMGLGCAAEHPVETSWVAPQPGAIGTAVAFGETGAFAPTEGERFTVIGTGLVADLHEPAGPNVCDDAISAMYQGGVPLPPPLQSAATGGDCEVDPTLVGSGDCSSTIEGQFIQGNGSYHDYAELRFTTTVPDEAHALEFDFAFFSREYPVFYGREFNDMFVAWMESEWWTGNISFDDAGNPISLNAGFLDYRDAQAGTENDPDCVDGCVAPELHGTCMEGHAGTQWLTTSAPVQPGQPLMVVFAIFDLSDPNLDSYAFIDGVRWGCEGGPVVTEPAG